MRDLIYWPVWPLVLILGYPALTIAFLALGALIALFTGHTLLDAYLNHF
jgi:hypothetical protein